MEGTNQPGNMQAPASLLAKVETRLRAYHTYIAQAKAPQEQGAALHHPRWEIRSAAVEALSMCDPQSARELLLEALYDENCFVRMAAIRALGQMDNEIPVERLLLCLQDHDWQVREIAVLTLGDLAYPETCQYLEAARSDITREVRTAADLALQAYDHQLQQRQPASASVDTKHPQLAGSAMSHKEKKSLVMDITQMPSETTGQQATMTSLVPAAPLQPRQRRATRKVLLLATAVIVLVALTAAGFSYSWWNAAFGNPDLYQTVQQQQTNHGVTIVVTKVYVDEGRTVIAYDTYAANHAQDRQFFPDHTDLRGSVPAKNEGPLQATFGDPLRDGVTHSYMVIPAFLVPANVNTVTITWDIGRMLVSQPGQEKQPPAISGHWHFSFTVPFHHTDNPNIPDPIHGEMISPQ